jgi:pimeloyl-ACP methyl ester carboxylesterase
MATPPEDPVTGSPILNHRRAGAGEPLLLVHATLGAWIPVIPVLSTRHDVIAVDLPGFGGSAPLADGVHPTVSRLADAASDQLDVLGLATVHLAGNSLGGWVALELARRGRARTVVAISPIGLGTDRENRRARRALGLVHAIAPTARPIVGPVSRKAFGRTVLGGAGLQLARPWRHEPAEMVAAVRDYWMAPGFDATLRWAFTHRAEGLEEIGCQVTIAWGTRDLLLPFRQAARFEARIRHARLQPLKGLGHVPMSDDPAVVASVILETAGLGSSSRKNAAGDGR